MSAERFSFRAPLEDDLRDLLARPAWHAQAACHGSGDLFFPPKGDRDHLGDRAKAICATCPVTEECKEAGKYEQFGIWGGLNIWDRKKAFARRPYVKKSATL